MSYKVYKHTTPSNKVYIGITSRPVEDRWKNGHGYKNNCYFSRAIKKYGWENIRHEILDTGLSKEDAETKERQYIAEYRSNDFQYGYNLTDGGEIGKRHSEESKQLMSIRKREQCANPEYRKMLSEAHKGLTPWNKGIPMTEEQKKKVSEAKKGCPGPLPKKVMCVETGIIYVSMAEASRQTGTTQSKISLVCCGKRKTTGGYHWKFVEESI